MDFKSIAAEVAELEKKVETLCRAMGELKESVNELTAAADTLAESVDDIWFAPNNPGFQQAKEHFEDLLNGKIVF